MMRWLEWGDEIFGLGISLLLINVCYDDRRLCRLALWLVLVWEYGLERVFPLVPVLVSPHGRAPLSPPCMVLVSQRGWWWSSPLARPPVGGRECGRDRVVALVRPLVLVLVLERHGVLVRWRAGKLELVLAWWSRLYGIFRDRHHVQFHRHLRSRLHHGHRNCSQSRHLRLLMQTHKRLIRKSEIINKKIICFHNFR